MNHHKDSFIKAVAYILERSTRDNSLTNGCYLDEPPCAFDCTDVTLSLLDYCYRLASIPHLEVETIFTMAIIHIDRLLKSNMFHLRRINVYCLFFTTVLVSMKISEDCNYSNGVYGNIGGIPDLRMVNTMEQRFLQLCSFDTFIEASTFLYYQQQIEKVAVYILHSPYVTDFHDGTNIDKSLDKEGWNKENVYDDHHCTSRKRKRIEYDTCAQECMQDCMPDCMQVFPPSWDTFKDTYSAHLSR